MINKVLKGFRAIVLIIRGHVDVAGKSYSIAGFSLNQILKAIIGRESYEVDLDGVIRSALMLKAGAFLDVGANVGQTLIKLLSIEATRQYVGFEPQLSGCSSINRFLTDNGLTDHTILPVGLADKTGIVKLGTRTENDGSASIVDEYRPKGFHTLFSHIPVFKGDEVVDQLQLNAVALIKIDVEGAELEVLRGFSNTLVRFRPFLLFEILPHYLLITQTTLDPRTRAARDARHKEIDRFIRSLEYTLVRVESDGRIGEVSELKAAERQNHNYLAVPDEHIEAFRVNAHGGERQLRCEVMRGQV